MFFLFHADRSEENKQNDSISLNLIFSFSDKLHIFAVRCPQLDILVMGLSSACTYTFFMMFMCVGSVDRMYSVKKRKDMTRKMNFGFSISAQLGWK